MRTQYTLAAISALAVVAGGVIPVSSLLNTWYEGIFKSTWANPEVGTAMVELVDGTPTIPDRIRFTIDPTVPDMTEEGGLEHQHPTALLGLGTFRRTRV